MPPRKSLVPKPRGPPRTPPELRSLKLSISFRADQKVNLDRLKADHRLSLLCQQAGRPGCRAGRPVGWSTGRCPGSCGLSLRGEWSDRLLCDQPG